MRSLGGKQLVAAACLAHIFSLAGIGTFPALVPLFFDVWGLSNTEAGWISGIYYGGYAVAVPILAGLTDRMDARRVYMASAALGAIALAGFALLANGFWSALILRALAGIALAGTYMPGLKMLTDRVEAGNQSRMIAFYTASFGLGSSLSIWMAGAVAEFALWRWAFATAALGSLAALATVALTVAPHAPMARASASVARFLDFRPVFRNRAAMAYVLAYGAHCWELLGFRAWFVAFLTFSATLQTPSATIWSATATAAVINLLGVPASILGNEMAVRFGRRRTASVVMLASAAVSLFIGFTAFLPYVLVVALLMVYGVLVTGDSATVTAGAVAAAPPETRGAVMAVHSAVGFATSFFGPLFFGIVLDVAGGNESLLAWGLGFAAMGLGVALGPLALAWLAPREGERRGAA